MVNDSVSIKIEFWKYVIINLVISALNVLFYTDSTISAVIAAIEILILFIQLLRGNMTRYLSYYMIFMCHCIEFSQFVEEDYIYNLKNFRLFGINFGAWLLLPVIVYALMHPIKVDYLKKNHKVFLKYSNQILLMNFIAMIVGAVLIGVDDNEIQSIGNIGLKYIQVIFSLFFFPLVAILAYYVINGYEERSRYLLPIVFQSLMWGVTFQFIISLIFGKFGVYGGVPILASSIMYFILPFALLIGINKKQCLYPVLHFVVIIIGIFLTLLFNANGKIVLFMVVIAFIWGAYLMKEKNVKSKVILIFSSILLILVIPPLIIILSENILFKSKYEQVLSLICFWEDMWLEEMSQSPRIRIGEFISMCIEYFHKPWLIITGKGYMGSIKDWSSIFIDSNYSRGAFSPDEWAIGAFYNMHEITTIFLIYGLFGLFFVINLIKLTIKNFTSNIWLILGCTWFVLLYGYSFTLAVFGIMVLMYGLSEVDNPTILLDRDSD